MYIRILYAYVYSRCMCNACVCKSLDFCAQRYSERGWCLLLTTQHTHTRKLGLYSRFLARAHECRAFIGLVIHVIHMNQPCCTYRYVCDMTYSSALWRMDKYVHVTHMHECCACMYECTYACIGYQRVCWTCRDVYICMYRRATGWRRSIGCHIFAVHIPQMSTVIVGWFAQGNLKDKAFYESSLPFY